MFTLRKWFHRPSPRHSTRRPRPFRPQTEPLEDRNLLSLASNPAVAAYSFGGNSYVDTYTVGTDGSLKEGLWANDGRGWGFHWNNLGQPFGVGLASDPAVVTYSFGGTFYVDIYALGTDGSLKEAVYANAGWGWGFHWNDLGTP